MEHHCVSCRFSKLDQSGKDWWCKVCISMGRGSRVQQKCAGIACPLTGFLIILHLPGPVEFGCHSCFDRAAQTHLTATWNNDRNSIYAKQHISSFLNAKFRFLSPFCHVKNQKEQQCLIEVFNII